MSRLLLAFIFIFTSLQATKLKDISSIVGVRDNQLIGYGIVVGLKGTGDGGSLTKQNLASMLQSVNIKVEADDLKPSNVASVVVTSTLPPFSRQGDKLDVMVSSIGDAKSLAGGTLLLTTLKAVDGKTYAVAQGAITVGKIGGDLTVGNIFGGALVEREVDYKIYNQKVTKISLKDANFANAVSIQNELNEKYSKAIAKALDARTIEIQKPEKLSMVEFIAKLQEIEINYEKTDKIVINEKTGTVVAGVDVKVDPVVINHGDITVKISPTLALPFPDEINKEIGDGVMIEDNGDNSDLITTNEEAPTVANITRALKKLGVSTGDIIAILTAMKKVGAIRVDLEVI
jgi:flagellar P-ring protein precursor FlgI